TSAITLEAGRHAGAAASRADARWNRVRAKAEGSRTSYKQDRADSTARRGHRRPCTRVAAFRRTARNDQGSGDGRRSRLERRRGLERPPRWPAAGDRVRRPAATRAGRAYTGAAAIEKSTVPARVPQSALRT